VRQFSDAAGIEWRVFLTERSGNPSSRDHRLPEAFRGGWLVFESDVEKRRLAPVPPNWESLTDDELTKYCAQAISQAPRGPKRAVDPSGEPAAERSAAKGVRPPTESAADRLRPELRRVEERLEKTLEQVCDAPTTAELDTGELIRIEKTLALAADAAKQAVSLRRKLRSDGEGSPVPGDR